MFRAIVQCPFCKNIQKYENPRINRKSEVYQKTTTCRVCYHNFTIKGAETDRIIKIGWEGYEEIKNKKRDPKFEWLYDS